MPDGLDFKIITDLKEFIKKLRDFEEEGDDIVSRAAEKTAADMEEIVAKSVRQSQIEIGGTKHEKGPGPHMSSTRAWNSVRLNDFTWQVRPHPEVEDRAVYLHMEMSNQEITPDGDNPMSFRVGSDHFVKWRVSGSRSYNYWRMAVREVQDTNVFERHLEREFDKAAEKSGLK